MPRINIEDKWFDDPRRWALVERIGQIATDGAALQIWRVAQNYYRQRTLIPHEVYSACKHAADFIAVKLAEERPDGVYVKGSTELFNWIRLKSEAGQKGGRANKRDAEHVEADESKREQNEASYSSSVSLDRDPSKEEDAPKVFEDPEVRDFVSDASVRGQKAWLKRAGGNRAWLEAQLLDAHCWWICNPDRHERSGPVPRFVNGWVTSALKERPPPAASPPGAKLAAGDAMLELRVKVAGEIDQVMRCTAAYYDKWRRDYAAGRGPAPPPLWSPEPSGGGA
jgi:hypothetical protein